MSNDRTCASCPKRTRCPRPQAAYLNLSRAAKLVKCSSRQVRNRLDAIAYTVGGARTGFVATDDLWMICKTHGAWVALAAAQKAQSQKTCQVDLGENSADFPNKNRCGSTETRRKRHGSATEIPRKRHGNRTEMATRRAKLVRRARARVRAGKSRPRV